ncbi:tail fiber domain-containing protein [Pantoea dispersa]|uniref:tail fiber domain-containing protein n=1 Tax=Pantoea dispersa TaxID=59814 RepID=UPI003B7F97FE
MPAGTIALTNNSATVTGSGTSFTTELKVNDFVVSTVGGVAYTLGVKSIESNTSLTLMEIYTGPSASGQSWTPVPYGTMAAITAQLAAQVTYAIRGLNLDKANWQQIFTGSGTVTVTLPDGTSWQGPAWSSITSSVLTKADNLASVSSKTAARANLGLGSSSTYNIGNTANTVAVGDDARFGTVDNKSGGNITSGVIVNGAIMSKKTFSSEVGSQSEYLSSAIYTSSGTLERAKISLFMGISSTGIRVGQLLVDQDGSNSKIFTFRQDTGNGTAPGTWVNGSDERHKSNIEIVPDALRAVMSWRGCTYQKLDGGEEVGLIAQDVEKDCPVAVINTGPREFSNGMVIEDFKSLNTAGVSAAYHTEAIKSLFNLVELALVSPDDAIASIDAIKKALSSD